MKPVFGYLRVSGNAQLEGDGFDRQKDTIDRFCAANGYFVLRWFQDGAVSGTVETSIREGFAEMVSLMGEETTKIAVVERADRLARTLVVSEIACEEVRTAGLTLLEAASGTNLTDSSDPTRVLIRQLLGVLSEWNKNVAVKRLRASRDRIRKETGRCEGRLPYGRRGIPDEVETLSLIMTMRDSSGHTFDRIARELRSRKIVLANRDGFWWTGSTVWAIYNREREIRNKERVMAKKKVKPEMLDGLPV